MKIYIHHFYQKSIFYKIGHNTVDRIFNIQNKEGNIKCKYNDIDVEFIFKQEISFEDDGYHILDYFNSFLYGRNDPKIGIIESNIGDIEKETQQILGIFIKLLKECPKNQKWIITLFRTEKLLQNNDSIIRGTYWNDVELLIKKLSSHHIISDNFIMNPNLKLEYPNFYFALTNTIYQWNENIGIRWFYEFKQIYNKINFDYDLMYSIRNHKMNRVDIINELSKLNNQRLFLQHSDSLQNLNYDSKSIKIPHIPINSVFGENDFEDISYIKNHEGYLDVFFRVLPKAKMQILCESWSWSKGDFTSQYLSEKTFGLLLSGIPFISTHDYPLLIIEKMLDVPPHPFYEESKRCRVNGKLFAEFVDIFLQNFDENFKLCKEWSDLVHTKLMYKIENENSLLDLIIDGGLKTEFIINKSLI